MTNYSKIPASIAVIGLALMVIFTGAYAQTCTVNWNNVHQRIDGFGASSAWRSSWTTAQADMFFSTNNGIGLSLLRNHIYYASSASPTAVPTTTELSIMTNAQARGALVWSTPWTPAAGFKSASDIYDTNQATDGGIDGGSFQGGTATNLAYASQLANYVASLTNYGIHLYAISIQNEPDANVTSYEACQWTNIFFHDFVTNLYIALTNKGVGSTKIILPESENWQDYHNLAGPAMTDPNVAQDVGIIADHNYDGANGPPSLTKNSYGKSLWETEVSTFDAFDGSISNGIYWGGRIYLFLTQAQVNAYHYWWLIPSGTDNEGLTDQNGNPAKRMYVLGQWSRFVRPGYYRIDATNTGGALITAFNNASSGNFAIVAVNTNASASIVQTFNLTNFPSVSSVTPWITSATLSLSNQAPVAVSGASFTYTLPAQSVVTFVGQAANAPAPPTLTAVSNQIINAQQTLQITNVATDPNVPPNTLTFNLLTGPTGATLTPLNGTNAVFAWTPSVNQANTTNPVAVVVTDNQTLLSATNNFNVIVNPLPPPVLVPVADQTVNAGVTLLVTNVVTDAYVPPLTLSFSLLSGPGAVNAASGVYSWRPPVNQAGTTNAVTVMVADSETPSQNATNSFNVIVNPLSSLPAISSINVAGGQASLTVTGPQGPDYTVLTSTNLTNPLSSWQVLLTTNSPVTPVTLVLPITPTDPCRFYSIQIGP
jgi:glucuronoarabinoxylan endo-1,4-beta-xylanase